MGVAERRGVVFAGVALAVAVLAGCELEASDTTPDDAGQSANPIAHQESTAPIDAGASGVGQVNLIADVRIESCVEQTMVRAYVGDEFWGGVWASVDQDEGRLRVWCSDLAAGDPVMLDELHANWLHFEAAVATTEPIPAVSPIEPVPPPPAVVQSSSECHPSYDPCVPIGFDADCASGRGDGPIYVDGPVRVIGPDEYGLDHDNDAEGCERD